MKPILEIQHISKKFQINHEQQPYLSLRDSFTQIFKSKNRTEDYWALKDVCFNVGQGDTVGIIGKNGAGKSTLLKILSKITPPTNGKIIGRGRIASLLEVGTGFHLELSGRENVFMNGSILGMRRVEILKNFDAIVDFAEVGKFIDTPLKHYSSGMQLRLAFAVAAFLENEILIIDEVLAVGDSEFQKKCMGKMEDVSKNHGRTVLFVSHNMAAIESLCKRCILIQKGTIAFNGNVEEGVIKYLTESHNQSSLTSLKNRKDRQGSGELQFTEVHFINEKGINTDTFYQGDSLFVDLYYQVKNKEFGFAGCHFSLSMVNYNGEIIFGHQNLLVNQPFSDAEIKQNNKIRFELKNIPFRAGEYFFNCDCVNYNSFVDAVDYIGSVHILQGNIYNYTKPFTNGLVAVQGSWIIGN